MGYQLGIDLGTTYTAAAVCRSSDRGWVEPEVVSLGSRSATVASVLFLAQDGSVLVGDAAERRVLTDPDRVVREFKRRVGDPTPIVVGGPELGAGGAVGPAGALGDGPGGRARGRARGPDRGHPPGVLGAAQEGPARPRAGQPGTVGDLPGRAAGRGAALRLHRAGRGRLHHRGVRPRRRHLRRRRGAQGRRRLGRVRTGRLRAAGPAGGARAAGRHRLRRGGVRARPGRDAGGVRQPGRRRPGGAVRGGPDPARLHRGQGGAEQRHRGLDPGAAAAGARLGAAAPQRVRAADPARRSRRPWRRCAGRWARPGWPPSS